MPLYYYEGVPIVAPLTIESNEPFFSSDTLNLNNQRVSQGVQRWELSFNILFKDDEQDFLINSVANNATFKTMIMPQLRPVDSKVTAVATLTVSAAAAANQASKNVTSSESGTLVPRGSFIKFANHKKLYMLKNDVITNGGVAVNAQLYPRLTTAVAAATACQHPGSTIKPVLSYYTSVESLKGITYEDGVLVNPGLISIIEAIG